MVVTSCHLPVQNSSLRKLCHLLGWGVIVTGQASCFVCPWCEAVWCGSDQHSVLLHKQIRHPCHYSWQPGSCSTLGREAIFRFQNLLFEIQKNHWFITTSSYRPQISLHSFPLLCLALDSPISTCTHMHTYSHSHTHTFLSSFAYAYMHRYLTQTLSYIYTHYTVSYTDWLTFPEIYSHICYSYAYFHI